MGLKRIEDLALSGKRVLVRADLNVTFRPGSAAIADDSRIRASLPTIEFLRLQGAKVLVSSHLGRPKGRVVEGLDIEPVRQRMAQLLGDSVTFAGGPVGDVPESVSRAMRDGDVAMLENLRFDQGEESNDSDFAARLAGLADIYVNDAFGASHRSHASIAGIARYKEPYAGLLMRSEIEMLSRALESDEHPTVAVLGGAKVADKLVVVKNLSRRVESILIGGGMVAAFQCVMGLPSGAADVSKEEADAADSILGDPDVAAKLLLPADLVAADEFSEDSAHRVVTRDAVPEDSYILDIGDETIAEFTGRLAGARKIIWNGPMGLFEWPAFSSGTAAVARSIARNSASFSLAGGGSTVEAIASLGLEEAFTHISTGGGASLEYLEGKLLPGIAVLAKTC